MLSVMLITMKMGHMMTKLKMKKSNYQKAIERMEKETNRALAQVELLSKLYAQKVNKKKI
jgi:hypothetical protein